MFSSKNVMFPLRLIILLLVEFQQVLFFFVRVAILLHKRLDVFWLNFGILGAIEFISLSERVEVGPCGCLERPGRVIQLTLGWIAKDFVGLSQFLEVLFGLI